MDKRKKGIWIMILTLLGFLLLFYAVDFDLKSLIIQVGFPATIFVIVWVYGLCQFILSSDKSNSQSNENKKEGK